MKPILTKSDQLGDQYEHPAYGMISYGRVTGGTNLVGSELRHNHFIKLEIQSARKFRAFHEDRFYSDKNIIEVWLSEQQWATFIASPHTMGVPCTISHRPDPTAKLISIDPPEEENKHDLAKKELKKYGKEITANLEKAFVELRSLLDNTTIKKSDLRIAISKLDSIISAITYNLPFHVDQHKELMENNLMAAKSDIEGYLTSIVYSLGLEKLREISPRIDYNPSEILQLENESAS